MLIKSGTIRVRKYEGEDDLSKQILACFEKFRQGEVKDYRQGDGKPATARVEPQYWTWSRVCIKIFCRLKQLLWKVSTFP